ncbi:hypothetical protein [Pedobacter sp. MW01-1-1]|uniref:hypothetical protein n=1 Tax=Pedobacter sp. MW01-1-1 TaxID=3383027 RepID=UPI003FEFD731
MKSRDKYTNNHETILHNPFLLVLTSCKKDNSSSDDSSTYTSYEQDEEYNGTYCAEIEYYNPDTGTRNTYELDVEVEDGSLVQINWPNGGWLDDTHFSPPEVDEDGFCSFTTYDGKEYEIQIDGEGSCSYSSSSPEEDDDELEQQESEQERDSHDENEESEEEISIVFPNLFPAKSFINTPYKLI